jgi:hypothetical protein
MAKQDSSFDINVLCLSLLIAIAGIGYICSLSTKLGNELAMAKISHNRELPAIPIERVKLALDNLAKEADWHSPVSKDGKPVPLLKSIIVVQKNGEPFDLYNPEPKLRPPMTNEYLVKHGLDFLVPNVGDLDPDGDGFSNLEEFNSKTNPQNNSSHPPLTDHLYLVERTQDDYVLALFSNSPPYSVRRVKPPGARVALINSLPYEFGFEVGAPPRFRAIKFNEKSAVDPNTQLPIDVSEMNILDMSTNEEFVLVNKKEKNLAAFQAKLQFRHGVIQDITVKKGESFRIAGIGSTFKLVDVQHDSAKVAESAEGAPIKDLLIKLKP